MEPIRIDLDPFEMSKQKVYKDLKHHLYVELHEHKLVYSYSFYSSCVKDENDPSLGWEDHYDAGEEHYHKSSIGGIERYWLRKPELWCFKFKIACAPESLMVYFETESKCREFFDKISNWLFNESV